MSMLSSASSQLRQLAAGITGPTRDQLVEERDRLLAAPPPAASTMAPPAAPPACGCPSCTTAAAEALDVRVRFAAWQSRVTVLERQLAALTWGGPKERDAAGEALAELADEVLRAFDVNKARGWTRRVVVDGRGRERAFETASAVAEVSAILLGLYRSARESMPFLGTDELRQAIDAARARKDSALALPLERPIDPEVARRAGTTRAPDTDAADGLAPDPSNPSVLGGTVRFSRRK